MLFDKNGIYYMDDAPNYYDFAIDIINGENNKGDASKMIDNKSTIKLYNKEEALKRGNAFPALYDGYKNYMPDDIKIKNKRERDLLDIQMLDFEINDLNLYLDLNPNDNYTYQIFKKYVQECKEKKEEYTKNYGPLLLDNLTGSWSWSNGVWPWEEGNN